LSGKSAFGYLPQLKNLLRDEDMHVRIAAATALGSLRHEAKTTVPVLVSTLTRQHEHALVRMAGARALRRFGAKAKVALPQLGEELKKATTDQHNGRHVWQSAVAETILLIDPEGAEARPALQALLRLLGDHDRDVRLRAARALGHCGPHVSSASPELVRRLRDGESLVRVAAAEALLLIWAKDKEMAQAVEVLSSGLGSTVVSERLTTIRAISRIGSPLHSLSPCLRKLLNDPNRQVREAVETAVARIDASGTGAK
jgi:HEAT repeat protein